MGAKPAAVLGFILPAYTSAFPTRQIVKCASHSQFAITDTGLSLEEPAAESGENNASLQDSGARRGTGACCRKGCFATYSACSERGRRSLYKSG